MKKDDGTTEVIKTKNVLLAVGSEVTPFPGIDVRYIFIRIDHLIPCGLRRSMKKQLFHPQVHCH